MGPQSHTQWDRSSSFYITPVEAGKLSVPGQTVSHEDPALKQNQTRTGTIVGVAGGGGVVAQWVK